MKLHLYALAPFFGLAIASAAHAVADQTCCEDGVCISQSAETPCALKPSPPPPPLFFTDDDVEFAALAEEEEALPAGSLSSLKRAAVTARGVLGIALTHPLYRHVFVGVVESSSSSLAPHPDYPAHTTPVTSCTVRVLESFRGAPPGTALTITFVGGTLASGVVFWPPHLPRCTDGAVAILTVYEKGDLLRPSDRATVTLLDASSNEPWEFHAHLALLRQLAYEVESE